MNPLSSISSQTPQKTQFPSSSALKWFRDRQVSQILCSSWVHPTSKSVASWVLLECSTRAIRSIVWAHACSLARRSVVRTYNNLVEKAILSFSRTHSFHLHPERLCLWARSLLWSTDDSMTFFHFVAIWTEIGSKPVLVVRTTEFEHEMRS